MRLPHPLQERVWRFIIQEELVQRDDRILIGVSGGPDSVALLDVLIALKPLLHLGTLTIIHFDHQLRGDISREDACFVRSLADRYAVPFCEDSEDVRARQRRDGISLEMAARACRHDFFQNKRAERQAHGIALGHTANDQAEELLLRLVRGTGPSGLTGMAPRSRQGILRPLLQTTRSEILDYLQDRALPYREDATNAEPLCQRNALRLEVLPLLERYFHGSVVRTLGRHAQWVRQEESWWEGTLEELWPKVRVRESPSLVVFRRDVLMQTHRVLQRRLLRHAVDRLRGNMLGLYSVHLESLCRWINGGRSGSALALGADLRAVHEGEFLHLIREPAPSSHFQEPSPSLVLNTPGQYHFMDYTWEFRLESPESASSRREEMGQTAHLDAQCLRWPLMLRTWRPGDRFRPLGLGGTKKLQDFFTDLKIPRSTRHLIPILCDQAAICWVSGYRLDDRVRVTTATRQVLVVRMEESEEKTERCSPGGNAGISK